MIRLEIIYLFNVFFHCLHYYYSGCCAHIHPFLPPKTLAMIGIDGGFWLLCLQTLAIQMRITKSEIRLPFRIDYIYIELDVMH